MDTTPSMILGRDRPIQPYSASTLWIPVTSPPAYGLTSLGGGGRGSVGPRPRSPWCKGANRRDLVGVVAPRVEDAGVRLIRRRSPVAERWPVSRGHGVTELGAGASGTTKRDRRVPYLRVGRPTPNCSAHPFSAAASKMMPATGLGSRPCTPRQARSASSMRPRMRARSSGSAKGWPFGP